MYLNDKLMQSGELSGQDAPDFNWVWRGLRGRRIK